MIFLNHTKKDRPFQVVLDNLGLLAEYGPLLAVSVWSWLCRIHTQWLSWPCLWTTQQFKRPSGLYLVVVRIHLMFRWSCDGRDGTQCFFFYKLNISYLSNALTHILSNSDMFMPVMILNKNQHEIT